jgi:CBS domain-containing protein
MNIDRVDAVPVVDHDGTVLGLITAGDLVAAIARFGIEERLSEDAR